MLDRRQFLGAAGTVSLFPLFAKESRPAAQVAEDETFWLQVAQAFPVDRSMINLNNGGVSPCPTPVFQAQRKHLEFSNQIPSYHMWRVLEPNEEGVRQRLAKALRVDAEEIAITRNSSESLMTCQFGLQLRAGDEVLTTNQDYPRMLNTFRQRVRREGIALREISLPVPCEDDDEVVARFSKAITPRTRMILVCHMINLTGQILPVQRICTLGREHGIPVVVDGAHALFHFPFTVGQLDCEFYGSSLHKWLFAPIGTGLLYVRKARIADVWPLMAAAEKQDDDIRKFEEIGTHPVAQTLAIGEALTFHEMLGAKRKAARLVYLRERWMERLAATGKVRFHTSRKPGFACGIGTVELIGMDQEELASRLLKEHRIVVTLIRHPEFQGIRVSPSVYTTLGEIDRFCAAVEGMV